MSDRSRCQRNVWRLVSNLARPRVWLCAAAICLAGWTGSARAGTHIWNTDPAKYPIIDPQAAADGAITYDIDLSGFNLWDNRGLTGQQILELNDQMRQAFDKWNEVIAPVGLQFRQAKPGEVSELPVRAVPYDYFDDYFGQTADTVGLSLAWPYGRVYLILPIWFDATEPFGATHSARVIANHLLSQPYTTIVDSEQFDLYVVGVHELGHVLGLGHVGDAIRGKYNYNFLANTTVQVDPASLKPSQWLGGMQVDRRRPIIEIELYSQMVPLRYAYQHEIPPDDRATVAFTLRNLNPEGADQILAKARELYQQTSPLRFANVAFEAERSGAYDRNNALESAMPIQANQVIIASLFGPDLNNGPLDSDYYQLDLSDVAAGTPLVLDIDEANGLTDVGATKIAISLLDKDGTTVAIGQAVGDPPDADSYSPEDPILQYMLATPGVYYILVSQADEGTPGMYVLKAGVGGPTEPTGEHPAEIDTTGAGTPAPMHRSPLDGLCPGIGFTTLALSVAGVWLVRPRRGWQRERGAAATASTESRQRQY